jgi:hypothetical protein
LVEASALIGAARPSSGRRDPCLRFALEQEGLKVEEKAFDLLAAAAIDKAERRIADRDAVFRVDRVEWLLAVGDQFVVGFLDDGFIIPHRFVVRAGSLAVAIEIGEPAA